MHVGVSALEDGAYEINLPEGTYDVLARGDSSAARLTAVAVEGEETSVDVALTPGAVIRGHISTPVASALAAPVVVVRLAGSADVVDGIGKASCRERVCKYVLITVGAGPLK